MKTFANEFNISGIGVHSGKPANMRILPSKNIGIFFKRVDLNGDLIQATYDNVTNTLLRNTTVGNAPNCVQTIEHLMAALCMLGIDSAVIEIDGPEIPILDGSAKNFMEFFQSKIDKIENKSTKKIIVKREIIARQADIIKKLPFIIRVKLAIMNFISGKKNNGFVKLSPKESIGLDIRATIVYGEPIIGTQTYDFVNNYTDQSRIEFEHNISAARTFGKFSEWEYLKARGMARGANENNVIALNNQGDGTLNKLYWPDEFVRHKIIDVIGDMFTSGGCIIGFMESYKGSHALNNLVLRKLFSDPLNYDIIDS